MAKRGIEFQVNWIFILIAGALIIAFFFGIVQKQGHISEQKLSIKLSDHMEAVFSGAIESKGTTQPLSIPSTGIAFSCSKVCECNWLVDKKANSFYDNIIFAPDLIKGAEATAVAYEWKMPFRTANFLYLTNPNIKYYVVYEPSLPSSKKIFDDLTKIIPKEADYEAVLDAGQISNIKPAGYLHTKFVFLDVDAGMYMGGLGEEWEDESISAIEIQSGNTLIFYEGDEQHSLFWAKKELMLAGIYSADYDIYNCGIKKAFAKLATIAKINSERAEELEALVDKAECVYSNAVQELNIVSESADMLAKGTGNYQHLTRILNAQQNLRDENENILRQGCPAVF